MSKPRRLDSSASPTRRALTSARLCFAWRKKNFDDDSRVANATASLLATMHAHHTNNEFEMISSS